MSLWLKTWHLWHLQPRERLKLALGWLFYRKATHSWLQYLHAHDPMWRQVSVFPKLVTRIYRPYALRGLSCSERVEHMIDHHQSLLKQGLLRLFEASVDQPLDLLQIPTKNGELALLRLVSVHDGHREGEMHLQLLWQGQWLYSLSFLLRSGPHDMELLITRLQGSRAAGVREQIRLATKALYGLRPSVLMVQAARQFAESAGCKTVLLVSHRHRVALNPMRRWKIHADLESLWLEMGAEIRGDGLFRLSPSVHISADFSDVASNKRAEARRRAEVLQHTLREIDLTIQSYQGT